LRLITIPFQRERAPTPRHLRRDLGEGLRWVWREPVLRSAALLTGSNNCLGAGYTLIVIVIAQRQHTSAATIGLIFALGGVGGLLGGLCGAQVSQRLGFACTLPGSLWLYVVFWLPLAALSDPLQLGVLSAALFFIGPVYNVTVIGYRLAHTP